MSGLLFSLYAFIVWLGDLYIKIGKYFSVKLRLLSEGRSETMAKLQTFSSHHQGAVWVHCASLGEFEQGRPVIEKIKELQPSKPLILSFFSPSGFEVRKDYHLADIVVYLPSDLPVNMSIMVDMVRPSVFIFVKYELWWNLIRKLVMSDTKVFLISAVFRKSDYFFHKLLTPFAGLLRRFEKIFVQDEASYSVLAAHGFTNQYCAGDTRIDRVISRSKQIEIPDKIQSFTATKTSVIYGSVWTSDMTVVNEMTNRFPDFIHIIVPHLVDPAYIKSIQNALPSVTSLFSDKDWISNILIIDNIGMLSSLYAVAKYAYVGGGFQKGIHNILEPAVFKIPVFFGPNHLKFNEAVMLDKIGGAFHINTKSEMAFKISTLEEDVHEYKNVGIRADVYFNANQGATEKIMDYIALYL